MQERDLHEDVRRGARADFELQETRAAFDALRTALLEEIAGCPPLQEEKILKLHMAVQNLDAVRTALTKVISAGEHAAHSIRAREAIAVAGLTRP